MVTYSEIFDVVTIVDPGSQGRNTVLDIPVSELVVDMPVSEVVVVDISAEELDKEVPVHLGLPVSSVSLTAVSDS